jgi:hypothetical protein
MGVYVYGGASSIEEAAEIARSTLEKGDGLKKVRLSSFTPLSDDLLQLDEWILATNKFSV